MLSTLRHLIATVLLGLALSGVAPRAPHDWRSSLLLLIAVYAAAFGLARRLFGNASDRRAIRIT